MQSLILCRRPQSMANLASMYRYRSLWKAAEELYLQIIAVRKEGLDAIHPFTLHCMTNLSLTYCRQGRWKEAEELQVGLLKRSTEVLSEEHPDTLTHMNYLAHTYKSKGRTEEAVSLTQACYKLRDQVLRPGHPKTSSALDTANEWQMENEMRVLEIGKEQVEKEEDPCVKQKLEDKLY
jgi:hypothetical protein